MEDELLFLDRVPQVDLERRARGDRGLHVRIEETQRVASGGLGLVHRGVGAFHQFVDAKRVVDEQRDAGA